MSSFAAQSPSGRAGHAMLHHGAAALGNERIVVVGGYNETGPLAEIWIYDLARNLWSEIMGGYANKGPLPRVDFDACILANKVYLFGGMETDGEQALIYNDLWSFDLDSRRWTLLNEESPACERMGHVCVSVDNDHFLLHGGDCLGKAFSDLWLYTASSATWQRVHDHVTIDANNVVNFNAPCARSSHSACLISETRKLAVFGGMAPIDGELSHMNDFWLLDISAGCWNTAAWSWMRVEGSTGRQGGPGPGQGQGPGLAAAEEAMNMSNEHVFPSPRDMPAIVSVLTAVGPKLVVLGGFGLQEVEEEEEEEEEEGGAMDQEGQETKQSGSASKAAAAAAKSGEDSTIAVGYLGDLWTIDMAGTCTELDEDDVSFVSGSGETTVPAWGSGGTKRGAKLVSTSQGIISFGGFDGGLFCCALEKLVFSA